MPKTMQRASDTSPPHKITDNYLDFGLPDLRINIPHANGCLVIALACGLTFGALIGIIQLIRPFAGQGIFNLQDHLFIYLIGVLAVGFLTLWCIMWWWAIYRRSMPGHVRFVAVKIDPTVDTRGLKGWYFYGASISRLTIMKTRLMPAVYTRTMIRYPDLTHNFTISYNCPKPFYLDEANGIAIAAEFIETGGAVLLDRGLSQLRLSQETRRQIRVAMEALLHYMSQNSDALAQLVAHIPPPRNPLVKTNNESISQKL